MGYKKIKIKTKTGANEVLLVIYIDRNVAFA